MGRVPWNQRAVCPTRFAVWRRAKNHICKKCLRLPSASVFILDVVSKEAYTRIPNGPHVATPPMHETVMPRITLPSAAFSDGTWWAKQGNVLYQILREQPSEWQQEGDGSLATPNRDLDAGRLIYGVFFCCSCANQHRSRIGGSCTVTRSKLQRLAAVFEEPKVHPTITPPSVQRVSVQRVFVQRVYVPCLVLQVPVNVNIHPTTPPVQCACVPLYVCHCMCAILGLQWTWAFHPGPPAFPTWMRGSVCVPSSKALRTWGVLYMLTWKRTSRHNAALFQHLNFQPCSETEAFFTFWCRNMFRATTACTFPTLQLPKAFRIWGVLHIFNYLEMCFGP